MPNMLVMPAYELCDPMSLMVLVIAGNTTQAWSAVFYRWIGRFHNTSQSVTLGHLASNTSPPLVAPVYPMYQSYSKRPAPTPTVFGLGKLIRPATHQPVEMDAGKVPAGFAIRQTHFLSHETDLVAFLEVGFAQRITNDNFELLPFYEVCDKSMIFLFGRKHFSYRRSHSFKAALRSRRCRIVLSEHTKRAQSCHGSHKRDHKHRIAVFHHCVLSFPISTNLFSSRFGTVVIGVWRVTLPPQPANSSLSDPAGVVESASSIVHIVLKQFGEKSVAGYGYVHVWKGSLRPREASVTARVDPAGVRRFHS